MAKKKSAGGPAPGSRVRVRDGVQSPEFPAVSLAGWTGTIVETTGKPPALKIILEWDAETMARMPSEYVAQCEAQQLYYSMACLGEADLEMI
ncbi:MAG: hypothetical protein B7Z55_16465 [Planctomycetales bacterium 12-60-4]|nr:MAG: hypothetical protein B7Z55_16465 [Planctomycetales bacterium 12-60-4]